MRKIPDEELLKMAIEFNMGPQPLLGGHPLWWRHFHDDIRHNSVTVKNMGNPDKDKPDRWAILGSFGCLNKDGDWEYQPMNSSRTDDFYERCRYASVHEAVRYYRRWYKAVEKFALAKYKKAGVKIVDGMPLDLYKSVIVNYDEIPAELLKF